jgi:hypothetical protein
MSTVDELSPEDKIVYDNTMEEILNVRRTNSMKDHFLKSVLADDEVSHPVKLAVVAKAFRLPSGAAWGYANYAGKSLYYLSQAMPITKALAKIAAKNSNFTWAIIEHMFTVNTNVRNEAKEVFLINLNAEVANMDFLRAVTTIRKKAGIADSVILDRIRRSDPETIDIPDVWLLSLYTDPATV